MQGDHPRYAVINAGVKHFAAFDGPMNGGEADISDADWVQTYLAPFKKAFEAGAMSTMCTCATRIPAAALCGPRAAPAPGRNCRSKGTVMEFPRVPTCQQMLRRRSGWCRVFMSPFHRYAKLNGVWGCNNPKALTTWLRERMGFKGYVISDQGALHDPADSIRAGCEMEDGGGGYKQLVQLVQSGALNESLVTRAVAWVFYARMRTGEFDPPSLVPW